MIIDTGCGVSLVQWSKFTFGWRYHCLLISCGILPLEIETGRWQNKPVEERICKVCESGKVENEFYFIFSEVYTIISEEHFYKI